MNWALEIFTEAVQWIFILYLLDIVKHLPEPRKREAKKRAVDV